MKTNREIFVVSKLTLAVQGALMVMLSMPLSAYADDADVAALTQPTSSVEIGVANTSKDSAKFGEYNGLDKKGAYGIGNFNVLGGDAYKSYDGGGGVNRWEITGTNLGTTSRELGGAYSQQGKWDFGFKYDELQHNISDTYQTPLQGSMGGNNFTMPANFGVVNTNQLTTVNGVVKGGTQALTAAQLADFRTVDVHTNRKNASFNAGYNIDQQWSVRFDFNRLTQSGAKLISVGTDAVKGGVSNGSTWGGEKNMMLMNPTNYRTDSFNLALNWKGDKSFANVSYSASLFTDNYNSVTFPNFFVGNNGTVLAPPTGTTTETDPINTLSTAPSNQLHQLNLTGGYTFSPATKLVGGLAYGRNTQNEAYPFAVMQTGGLPQSSLDALVVNTHADLKLTNQTTRDLALSAGFKYNQRDNRTASSTYNFVDLGQGNATSVNAPMSNKKTQLELAGDYRINQDNRVRLAYEYEAVKRWCNNAAANSAIGALPAYYTTSGCAQMPKSTDNKIGADYKLRAGEAVSFNAGYSYAKRNADVNASFYNPMQAISEGYEDLGFRAFFQASRVEQLMKAGVNWQANDKLTLGLNGRYVDDKYKDSPLGVQNGHTASANLDASYSYSETGVVSAYVSVQNRQRDMQDWSTRSPIAPTAATYTYTNQLKDDNNTVGLNALQKGLMAGKLELSEDLTYSLSKTNYSTQVPTGTPGNPLCAATNVLTCGSTPDIKNDMLRLKITGNYQIDKASKVALGYMFQKLKSTDYYYNAYQYGYTSTGLLPTNEQAPSYTVNVITASYLYSF